MKNNFEENLDALINISINNLNSLENEDFSNEMENIMKEFETKSRDEKGEEFPNYQPTEKEFVIEEIFNNLETDEKKQQFIDELTEIYNDQRIVDPESIDSIKKFIIEKQEEKNAEVSTETTTTEEQKEEVEVAEEEVIAAEDEKNKPIVNNTPDITEIPKEEITENEKSEIEKYISETNEMKELLEKLKKNKPEDVVETKENVEDLNKLIEENNKCETIERRETIKEYQEKIEKIENINDEFTQKKVEEFKTKLNSLKEYYEIIDEMNGSIKNNHIPSVFTVDKIKNSKLSFEQKNELFRKYNKIVEVISPSVFMKKDNYESNFYQREEINELSLRIDMLKKYGTPEWTMNGKNVKNTQLIELENKREEIQKYFEIVDNINKLFDELIEPEMVQEQIKNSDFSEEVKEELQEKYNKTLEYCKNKKNSKENVVEQKSNTEIENLEKEIAERDKNISIYKESDKSIDELNTRLDNKEQKDSPEIQSLINNIKNKIEPLPINLKEELNKKLNNVLNKKRKKGLKVIAKKALKWMKEHKLVCIAIGLALTTALLFAMPATHMMINSALWNVGSKLGWSAAKLGSLNSTNIGLSSLVNGGKFAYEGASGMYTLGGAAGAQALYTSAGANLIGALAGLTGVGAIGTMTAAITKKIKNWKKKKDEPTEVIEKHDEKEIDKKEPEKIEEKEKVKEKEKETSTEQHSIDNTELLAELKEALQKSNEANKILTEQKEKLMEENRMMNEKLNQMFKTLTPEQQQVITGNISQNKEIAEFSDERKILG